MNTILKLILIATLFGCVSCSNVRNDEEYELNMSNVKKKVSIMVYKPVENSNNIEVVSSIIIDGNLGRFRSNSTIYYDTNNRIVYEAFFDIEDKEHKSTPHGIIKTVWYNSKENKKQTILEKSGAGKFKTVYDRNADGNLIQIEEFEKFSGDRNYTSSISSSYKYDSYGNRIEQVKYFGRGESERTVYMQFNDKKNPMRKLVYDSNNELSEECTFEYYPSNNLIKIEQVKRYKYGQQIEDTKSEYTYDSNNNMITQHTNTTSIGGVSTRIGVVYPYPPPPPHLSDKEREEYIRENYYGKNLKLKSENHYITYTYDAHNNLIHTCDYTEVDNKDNGIGIFGGYFPPSEKPTAYKYKYNEKGDWTELIKYHYDFIDKIYQPSYIVVRDIEYY